jgi:hypothetical protein
MVDKDILRQKIKVRTQDGRFVEYAGDSVEVVEETGEKNARNKEKR